MTGFGNLEMTPASLAAKTAKTKQWPVGNSPRGSQARPARAKKSKGQDEIAIPWLVDLAGTSALTGITVVFHFAFPAHLVPICALVA